MLGVSGTGKQLSNRSSSKQSQGRTRIKSADHNTAPYLPPLRKNNVPAASNGVKGKKIVGKKTPATSSSPVQTLPPAVVTPPVIAAVALSVKERAEQLLSQPALDDSTCLSPTGLSFSSSSSASMIIQMDRLSSQHAGNKWCGHVRVRFNHYNKLFPIYNSVLKWADVDDEYSFSFVYKGNYQRDLFEDISMENSYKAPATSTAVNNNSKIGGDTQTAEARRAIQQEDDIDEVEGGFFILNGLRHITINGLTRRYVERDNEGMYFLGLQAGREYRVAIAEDPVAGVGVEGLTIREGPLRLTSSVSTTTSFSCKQGREGGNEGNEGKVGGKCPLKSGNAAVSELTAQLLALNPSDLNSAEARLLREQRDIEDVLFSGTEEFQI